MVDFAKRYTKLKEQEQKTLELEDTETNAKIQEERDKREVYFSALFSALENLVNNKNTLDKLTDGIGKVVDSGAPGAETTIDLVVTQPHVNIDKITLVINIWGLENNDWQQVRLDVGEIERIKIATSESLSEDIEHEIRAYWYPRLRELLENLMVEFAKSTNTCYLESWPQFTVFWYDNAFNRFKIEHQEDNLIEGGTIKLIEGGNHVSNLETR